MNQLAIKLGAYLKQQRLSHSLSQEELASKIGISFQQIQKYEKGNTGLLLDRLFDLAKALNFKPSDALKKVEGSQKSEVLLDRESVEILKNYNAMKREHRDAVYHMIRALSRP